MNKYRSFVLLVVFAVIVSLLVMAMLIPKIAEPSMSVHGNQQAFVTAKLIAADINALSYADSGEITKSLDVEWDISIYCEKPNDMSDVITRPGDTELYPELYGSGAYNGKWIVPSNNLLGEWYEYTITDEGTMFAKYTGDDQQPPYLIYSLKEGRWLPAEREYASSNKCWVKVEYEKQSSEKVGRVVLVGDAEESVLRNVMNIRISKDIGGIVTLEDASGYNERV